MNLSLYIARRIANPEGGNKRSIMELFATIAVALSLAVMLLSMAVIMGFKSEIEQKISGFTGEVLVGDIRSLNTSDIYHIIDSESTIGLIESVDSVESVSRYALKGGIIKSESSIEGVMLKGVSSDYDFECLERWLTRGELPRIGDTVRYKDIIISEKILRRVGQEVGDKVEMLFMDDNSGARRDRFKIVGAFKSGIDEIDSHYAITDLRSVQRLHNWSSEQISGYEVRLQEGVDAQMFADRCNFALLYSEDSQTLNMVANSIYELYPSIFDWLKTHDVNAAVILGVMLVVALFNVVTVLLILVLERTRMIGVLKAMGMNSREVGKIFLYRSLFITLKGMAWGNGIALLLAWVQSRFALLKLDSTGYLLSEVPIDIGWGWWLTINVGAVVVIAITLIVPSRIVANISPEKSIRYQ